MSIRSASKSIDVSPSASARMRRFTSLVTKIVGSSLVGVAHVQRHHQDQVVGDLALAQRGRHRARRRGDAHAPAALGQRRRRRTGARRSRAGASSMRATSRALRPRSDASFLNWSISSRTKIGMTTSLSANWRIARGSWMRTFVSRTKCFMRTRSLAALGLLGLAARDRHLLHDDVGLRFVARAALRRR